MHKNVLFIGNYGIRLMLMPPNLSTKESRLNKSHFIFHAIFILILLFLNPLCFGSNGQVFDGINYLNPANNLFVKKLRFTLGTVVYNPKIPFIVKSYGVIIESVDILSLLLN